MVFAGDDFVSNKKLYTWGVYHHMLLTTYDDMITTSPVTCIN